MQLRVLCVFISDCKGGIIGLMYVRMRRSIAPTPGLVKADPNRTGDAGLDVLARIIARALLKKQTRVYGCGGSISKGSHNDEDIPDAD